ncbi:hypothetical protein M433DRAFT_74087 [Acidomyces richmondensis BFW]|nr:MAG: hypothetical protein FE78DRAFT_144626 [Acidomyces sp. 'richmondensis']KYG42297.1 hypothetical protein M433DRAFT_74087 [Acidomyces richmondensis BFW]
MAFNFNWSPLIADTERVRDMLTNSLNKSPKPPIIVDDIIVNELNLGSTPPELEILEVGDLAEDRFKGIFKMCYTGDAYLTLKTRVQANPLNTYLSTKPSFASITLVFRNDPVESLKVSSTFDSIPFVRDYLQRTIESRLRVLFMEDLPAIIHRLSLRVFSPDYHAVERQELKNGQPRVDSLARSIEQPFDSVEVAMEDESSLTQTETYATFSQKNLLRLAALSESQRTLSLFTPSIRDAVYRAWASAHDRNAFGDGVVSPAHRPVALSRIHSTLGSPVRAPSAASQTSEAPSVATRPSLASHNSHTTTYSFGGGASRSRPLRKRKHRIVNLRKDKGEKDTSDIASISSGYTGSASQSASGGQSAHSAFETEPTSWNSIPREGEISTPPQSPQKKTKTQLSVNENMDGQGTLRGRPRTPRTGNLPLLQEEDPDQTPRASMLIPQEEPVQRLRRPHLSHTHTMPEKANRSVIPRTASDLSIRYLTPPFDPPAPAHSAEGSTGGILEQAWLLRIAQDQAKRLAEESSKQETWRPEDTDALQRLHDDAPPAYVS